MEVLSYHQLFSYVELPSSFAAYISLCDEGKEMCYCEPQSEILTCVWYPIENWIIECKRRTRIEKLKIEEEANALIRKKAKEARANSPKSQLSAKLLAAALSGNEEEVEKIKQAIEALKEAGLWNE